MATEPKPRAYRPIVCMIGFGSGPDEAPPIFHNHFAYREVSMDEAGKKEDPRDRPGQGQEPRSLCDNCGACCRLFIVPPFDDDDIDSRFEDLPEELQAEINAHWEAASDSTKDYISKCPCLWLDPETKRCRRYELRPDACRGFEVGGELCLEDRTATGIENPP